MKLYRATSNGYIPLSDIEEQEQIAEWQTNHNKKVQEEIIPSTPFEVIRVTKEEYELSKEVSKEPAK
jgi:hypothetical protein